MEEGDSYYKEGQIYSWEKTVNLSNLTKDSDQDGLPDVVEERFFTKPDDRDTDGDGIPDGKDTNPLVGNVKMTDGRLIRQAVFAYLTGHSGQRTLIVKAGNDDEKQEYLGNDDVVLCLTPIEIISLREKIGYGIPIYSFGKIKFEANGTIARIEYSCFYAPLGANGAEIKLKKRFGLWFIVDEGSFWVS